MDKEVDVGCFIYEDSHNKATQQEKFRKITSKFFSTSTIDD